MKKYVALVILALAFLVVSCGSGSTIVVGDFGEKRAPDSISVIISGGENLHFPVINGQFTAEIPTTKTTSALVEGVYLIPDGNKMSIDFTASEPILDPKKSEINKRVIKYLEEQKVLLKDRDDFMVEYQAKIDRREVVSPEFLAKYSDIQTKLIELCRKTIRENYDNDLGAQALKMVYIDMKDAEINAILDSLSPEMHDNEFISVLNMEMQKRAKTSEGHMFTDVTITYTDGTPDVKLSDYIGKGKYILVDFWASWCGSCHSILPRLKEVYKNHKGDNFDILGIDVWDRIVDAKKAIKELSIPWPCILGTDVLVTDEYGINGIPTLILFGPDGTILHRDMKAKDAEAMVEELLGQ